MHGITASDLPQSLISRILQHVPLQQRLCSCALVCSTWAAAATAATSIITVQLLPGQLTDLQSWMKQHGQSLQQLEVNKKHTFRLDPARSVPEQQLQLQLPGLDVSGFLPCMQPGVPQQSQQRAMRHLPPGASSSAAAENSHQMAGASNGSAAATCTSSAVAAGTSSSASSSDRAAAGDNKGGGGRNRGRDRAQTDSASGTSSSSSCMAGCLQPLPCLQQLRLSGITASSCSHFLELAQLTTVTLLELGSLQSPGWYYQPDNQPSPTSLVSALLSGMPRLQDLCMNCMGLEPDVLTALSSSNLTALRLSLTLDHQGDLDGARPPCVPSWPGLSQLSQLRTLHISVNGFDAAVLASMPLLQQLSLYDCAIHAGLPDRDSSPRADEALLTALATLQHLQKLCLDKNYHYNNSVQLPQRCRPELYAALTASSQLTSLYVSKHGIPPWVLGGAQYVFPAGRQWQHLQEVHLEVDTGMLGMQRVLIQH